MALGVCEAARYVHVVPHLATLLNRTVLAETDANPVRVCGGPDSDFPERNASTKAETPSSTKPKITVPEPSREPPEEDEYHEAFGEPSEFAKMMSMWTPQ